MGIPNIFEKKFIIKILLSKSKGDILVKKAIIKKNIVLINKMFNNTTKANNFVFLTMNCINNIPPHILFIKLYPINKKNVMKNEVVKKSFLNGIKYGKNITIKIAKASPIMNQKSNKNILFLFILINIFYILYFILSIDYVIFRLAFGYIR